LSSEFLIFCGIWIGGGKMFDKIKFLSVTGARQAYFQPVLGQLVFA